MAGTLSEQITNAFQAEQRGRDRPLARGDLPSSYEAITPEWLSEILCRGVPGAEAVAVRLGPPDEGTNNRRRLYIDYNAAGVNAGLPPSVFCKATQGLANRLMLGHSGGVLCEVTFYNAARPLLDIEAPTALLAAYDPVSFNSILMLHDLGARAAFCSEATPVDRAFAERQLDLLARLHGRFFEAAELDGALSALPSWYERFHNLAHFHLEESCAAGVLAARALLPPELFARRDAIWPATLRSLDRLRGLPRTLCHGDVHLKNWYVLDDGRIGLGDWGVAHIGHWSRDLAYTIATALDVADRRVWERELIDYYLDRLAAAGVPRVSFDEALLRYRQSLPSAFAFWSMTLKPTPDFPDMQPEATARVFVKRLGHAMADLDALDAV